MILLDTNVLSALMRPSPDQAIVTWLNRQPPECVWVTSFTVFEVEFGLALLPKGCRRAALEAAYHDLLEQDLQGRVVPFDRQAAAFAATLAAARQQAGRPIDTHDTEVAGIALFRRATLATRNVAHFRDLDGQVLNPWESR